MKLSVLQPALYPAVQKVSLIIPSRTPLPILSNLLIEAEEGVLRMSATDLDVFVTTEVEASVEEEGGITLPARKFLQILRELPEGELVLHTEGERVILRSPFGRYVFTGLPADQFPGVPAGDSGVSLKISPDVLRSMIERTTFVASKDEARPVLQGVLWRVEPGGRISMVATDGHRLAWARVSTEGLPEDVSVEAIVPPKALQQLARLSSSEEVKEVLLGERLVRFELSRSKLWTRTIEGPYPNFEAVVPKGNDKTFTADVVELSSAVRRVSLLSDSETHQVRFSLGPEGLELSGSSSEFGSEAAEQLKVSYDGEPMTIGFDGGYLLEILKNVPGEEVRFELDTPVSAAVIRPASPEEGIELLYLLMPLRIME